MKAQEKNRIQFANEFAPRFDNVIEEEHNYYLRCPICGKSSEHKSKIILEILTCPHCKTEMTKAGALIFDALKDIRYLPF